MFGRIGILGNPFDYACYEDEALNLDLKRVLRNVAQINFEHKGLGKMDRVLSHRRAW